MTSFLPHSPRLFGFASLWTLLLAVGCSAKYTATEQPMPPPQDVYAGADADATASREIIPTAESVALLQKKGVRLRNESEQQASNTENTNLGFGQTSSSKDKTPEPAPSPGRAPEKNQPAPPMSTPPPLEPEPVESTQVSIRQMIYTAQMVISVFKLPEASAHIEEMTLQAGGYLQSMAGNTLVVRIPAAKLRPFMKSMGSFGIIESQSLQAQDVTEEYTDLSSRIRVLQQTQAQLLDLLSKARTVDEALHVRQALDQVTMELEQALGRMRMLENLIGFSTLTIHLQERGPYTQVPSANDPFPWVNYLGVEATEWK